MGFVNNVCGPSLARNLYNGPVPIAIEQQSRLSPTRKIIITAAKSKAGKLIGKHPCQTK
jgi:hypothetical protein